MISELLNLTPWKIVLVAACGVLSGLINTVAGGGSLLIVPLYLYLGIPPATANYINRIPIFLQATTATTSYAINKKLQWRVVTPYLLPILAGTVLGASLAVDITERTINRILFTVLCFVIISLITDFFEKKEVRHQRLKRIFTRKPSYWLAFPILFAVGLYGGFIQIGVGLVIYPVIHIIFKRHYLTATITKVCVIAFSCLLSLAIFWSKLTLPFIYLGLLTGSGSIIGSIIGVRVTVGRYGESIIRVFLILISIGGLLRLLFTLW